MNLLHSLAKIIIFPLVAVMSFAGYPQTLPVQAPQIQQQSTQTFGAFNPTGGGTYRLQSSVGTTNTSIPLSSFKEPISGVAYTMAYLNTDVGYGTLDPQQPTRSEFISFTGITQNSDGTALLTGVTRGLSRSYPYTASSTTFSQAHSGQSIFILSDAPGLFNEYLTKRGAETVTGVKTFASTSIPVLASDTSIATNLANGQNLVTVNTLLSTAFGTSTIGVSSGGTGATSFPTNSLLVGNGTSALQSTTSPSVGFINATSTTATSTLSGNLNVLGASTLATSSISRFTVTGTSTLATTTVNGSYVNPKFGGNGSDGALSISSGTTTINLSSATLVEKNYSSISITGTGALAFTGTTTTGTIVILKSQGDCTITSSNTLGIDLRYVGGIGGTAGTSGVGGNGSQSSFYLDTASHFGANNITAGVAITGSRNLYPISLINFQNTHFKTIVPGSGGGGGAGESGATGGVGGMGAGALWLECGGNLNFTGTINASGQAGTNGNNAGANAGGAGGAGGMVILISNNIVAQSGTINTNGGAGGNGHSGSNSQQGPGGGALLVAGGAGTTASNGNSGSSDTGTGGAGGTGGSNGAGGGGGAGGFSLILTNTEL